MENKHTPGPWVMGPDPEDVSSPKISIHLAGGEYYIAQVDEGSDQIANARLIAAAPDLLDALEWYADDTSSQGDIARAAIAKARGQ